MKNDKKIVLGVLILAVIGIGIFFMNKDKKYEPMTGNPMESHEAHMMAEMVTSEQTFLEQMVPHHQEAVDSSKSLLTKTKNPKLIELGNRIILTQTQEIEAMKTRLKDRFKIENSEANYSPMMRPIDNLNETDAELSRIQDMIAHHAGAIGMANKILEMKDIKIEIRDIALGIISTQQDEIKKLQDIEKEIQIAIKVKMNTEK